MFQKKRAWLILALVLAFLLWGGNELFGNPVSRWMAQNAAIDYLAQTYPSQTMEIQRIRYDTTSTKYHISVICPDSPDTYFTIAYTRTGELCYDDYSDTVASGENTRKRLDTEYTALIQEILAERSVPHGPRITGGLALSTRPELDGIYDEAALALDFGVIDILLEKDVSSQQELITIMMEIQQALTDAAVPYRYISFTALPARDANGNLVVSTQTNVYLKRLLPEDFTEEKLTEILDEAGFYS